MCLSKSKNKCVVTRVRVESRGAAARGRLHAAGAAAHVGRHARARARAAVRPADSCGGVSVALNVNQKRLHQIYIS